MGLLFSAPLRLCVERFLALHHAKNSQVIRVNEVLMGLVDLGCQHYG